MRQKYDGAPSAHNVRCPTLRLACLGDYLRMATTRPRRARHFLLSLVAVPTLPFVLPLNAAVPADVSDARLGHRARNGSGVVAPLAECPCAGRSPFEHSPAL